MSEVTCSKCGSIIYIERIGERKFREEWNAEQMILCRDQAEKTSNNSSEIRAGECEFMQKAIDAWVQANF